MYLLIIGDLIWYNFEVIVLSGKKVPLDESSIMDQHTYVEKL